MADHIKIRKADGTWVVRAGGAVLAETNNALELTEGAMAPVIFFPRTDIAMAFLEPSPETSHSPYLGNAQYFSIETKSRSLPNAAWTYEDPAEGMDRIKDHIAFYTSNADIAVERL
ncbi:DUF427 domain-containing protein [Tropicimonas isoalkanivorans]|uniref:Uncharacterized conserved protein, DUF427 family n=1 Tax=Tropicimonas isoalkanivorans TaxID=441112 RepID=A0A1I1G9X6_9RHOB|nr:DUF427 domain-containing protein [Tropicimonas isoalkanivorans]SFC05960.1 Uncharacterized conserved protein, DUF427 family [Tropicimonas isoalkanivorans]